MHSLLKGHGHRSHVQIGIAKPQEDLKVQGPEPELCRHCQLAF